MGHGDIEEKTLSEIKIRSLQKSKQSHIGKEFRKMM
jgi:hypothetical protein